MFGHGASKNKYIFPPDQYNGSIYNLKCFPCYSQVAVENLHIGILDLLSEKYSSFVF